MIDLFSVNDAAKLFDLSPSRLRYWIQSGLVTPSVRRGGRFYYTFADLIHVKTAAELTAARISTQRVRAQLAALRANLPERVNPRSRLRICSDGREVAVVDEEGVYEPAGRVVMAFGVRSLTARMAERLELTPRTDAAPANDDAATCRAIAEAGPTEPHRQPSAYRCFLDGCDAEERGALPAAELAYRRAIDLEPMLAAAHSNLGNILYQRGNRRAARDAYERALDIDPDLAEARFNLGSLLEDLGETELAIAELRRVCEAAPEFADAHYNLALLLTRVGGFAQARAHLERFLALEPTGAWAPRAKALVAALREPPPAPPSSRQPASRRATQPSGPDVALTSIDAE